MNSTLLTAPLYVTQSWDTFFTEKLLACYCLGQFQSQHHLSKSYILNNTTQAHVFALALLWKGS